MTADGEALTMVAELISAGIDLHSIDECLIVPVRSEIDDGYLSRLTRETLRKTSGTGIKGVLIDVSAVRVLEAFHFSLLADMAKMVSLLGARVIFVGFQAGVAATLIDLEVNIENIDAVVTMADGLAELASIKADREEFEADGKMEAEAVKDDPGDSRDNDHESLSELKF
jgi:anti-anti-sigma regulatory factor